MDILLYKIKWKYCQICNLNNRCNLRQESAMLISVYHWSAKHFCVLPFVLLFYLYSLHVRVCTYLSIHSIFSLLSLTSFTPYWKRPTRGHSNSYLDLLLNLILNSNLILVFCLLSAWIVVVVICLSMCFFCM